MNRAKIYIERVDNLFILPVCHYRMEFAQVVREAAFRLRPEAIAVELPSTVEERFKEGVCRLPHLSVLLYDRKEQEPVYILIEPSDPMVEAVRLGLEKGLPTFFIDVDGDEYPLFYDPLPDSYAVFRIGHEAYCREVLNSFTGRIDRPAQDIIREKGMAFRLQGLKESFRSILVVCGIAHLPGILQELGRPQTQPMGRVKRTGIQLFNLHPDSAGEVMASYPFLSSVYELMRGELPPEPRIDHYTVRKTLKVSPFGIIDGGKINSEEDALRASLDWSARRVAEAYPGFKVLQIDRQKVDLRLFEQAARHYQQDTGERVETWQKSVFFKFSRNYALLDGLLLADFYHLLVSARASVDDNFCYALWRLGTYYPWVEEHPRLPTIRIKGEDVLLGTRRIRIRRLLHRPRQRPVPLHIRKRPRERYRGEWLEGFRGSGICSYPPEDILVEDYGQFLKKKAGKVLSEQLSRSHPMETSLMDGIDIRETMRHFHEGKIFVKEHSVVRGETGSVVLIFDEDDDNSRFPFCMTWHGEHEQESDMAFYATDPADNIVGPGISRCEYGGFMLSYPPLRMIDVWTDPEYRFFEKKSEKLLAAALDYSLEKFVVYVAARPPRSVMKMIASRMGRKIIYIPIGALSSVRLKKIRVFHVLADRGKRAIAKDYIW